MPKYAIGMCSSQSYAAWRGHRARSEERVGTFMKCHFADNEGRREFDSLEEATEVLRKTVDRDWHPYLFLYHVVTVPDGKIVVRDPRWTKGRK